MVNIYKRFGVIVIDSSLLFSRLTDRFFEKLRVYAEDGGALMRYPAFQVEAEELEKAAGGKMRRIAKYNLRKLDNLKFIEFSAKELDGDCDCESLIRRLLTQDIEVAVAASNKLLIERLILNQIDVSIIDLSNAGTVVRPSNFNRYEDASDVLALAEPEALPYIPVKEGDTLFCGDGSAIELTSIFNSGGKEAVIYNCTRSGFVAKIFQDGVLTDLKLENIKNFIGFHRDMPWLACPVDVLYVKKEEGSNCPVGYLMKCVDGVTAMNEEELFLGDIDCFSQEKYKEVKPIYVVGICIAILRQVMYLHMKGILFGDYNGGNFAIKDDRSTDYVCFFDTDGYGYKKNPVVSAAAEFESPRTYNFHDKRDLLRSEYDNLYIALFRWMTLGMVPFSKDTDGNWVYRDWGHETEQRKARWAIIPTPLQKLFNKVFGGGQAKTPTELLYALKKAYGIVAMQPTYSAYFAELLSGGHRLAIPVDYKLKMDIFELDMPTPDIPPEPIPKEPPKRKWPYVLIVAILAAAVGLSVWYGYTYQDIPFSGNGPSSDTDTPVETGGDTKSAEPQMQRIEADDGYYLIRASDLEEPASDAYVEYYWDSGNVYKGDFKDGAINGQGRLYNATNDLVYDGGWKDGRFHGEGTYYFPNNTSYKDNWADGTCQSGKKIKLITKKKKPAAKGRWKNNIFYGRYREDGEWYKLP